MLRRTAPTWLMRLPHLLRPDERLRIEPSLVGATATRMLREGIARCARSRTSRPLVLLVEDLHWADLATLDLLAALARAPGRSACSWSRPSVTPTPRSRPSRHARSRASSAASGAPPRSRSAPFDDAAVADFLRARLGARRAAPDCSPRLDALSAGNPLFLRRARRRARRGGAFTAPTDGWQLADDADRLLADLPESLRAFVASEAARLPHPLRRRRRGRERDRRRRARPRARDRPARPAGRVADAASTCIGRPLLPPRRRGGWHDGSHAGRYAFPHASHRRIVYDGLADARPRGTAPHSSRSGSKPRTAPATPRSPRASPPISIAGASARARSTITSSRPRAAEARFAYREAAAHLTAALAARRRRRRPAATASPRAGLALPPARRARSCSPTGYSQPEVERAYARALAIFEHDGMPLGIFTAEMGLGVVDLTRARYRAAYERTRPSRRDRHGRARRRSRRSPLLGGLRVVRARRARARARASSRPASHARRRPGDCRATSASPACCARSWRSCSRCKETRRRRALEAERSRVSRRHGAVSERAHAELLAAERAVFLRDPAGRRRRPRRVALAEATGS